jgi:hypothetical protein
MSVLDINLLRGGQSALLKVHQIFGDNPYAMPSSLCQGDIEKYIAIGLVHFLV